MVDLLEDFWAFILVLFFVSLGIIVAYYVVIIIKIIFGEMPVSIELVIYVANWSIVIRYYLYTFYSLKRYKSRD